ncbi:MAG: hypothetical protein AB9873_11590 [Syntrophobacteraceae bacterium]
MKEDLREDCDHPDQDEECGDAYESPQLITVGSAVDLVRGLHQGKNNDGYSGFYWER